MDPGGTIDSAASNTRLLRLKKVQLVQLQAVPAKNPALAFLWSKTSGKSQPEKGHTFVCLKISQSFDSALNETRLI